LFASTPDGASTAAALRDADDKPCLPAGLIPLGLVSFSDELRPEAQAALAGFAEAGIRLKIISGDNPQTVAALAKQAGFEGSQNTVSGLELAEMDDAAFARAAETASIFGRITPQQKERLVGALRGRGHYVAMIGDGVNDVLSLKQAQLGIAMQGGSAATRAVADMVLLNDSFAALPAAFREGQRILRGMQDIMRLFLARTFYVTMVIIAALLVGAPFPVIPKHNFILALLTVGIPTLALAAWARPATSARRETWAGQPASSLRTIRHFVFPAAFTVAALSLGVYVYALLVGGAGLPSHQQFLFARTALTTATVFCGLLLIVFVEPPTGAWVGGDELSGDHRPTALAGLMLVCYGLAMGLPGLRNFFELTPLPAADLALIAALAALWALALRIIWRKRLFEKLLELE
jgi:cation-transporting ATPase E